MKAARNKTGKTNDVLDKFKPLYEKEKYQMSNGRRRRRVAKLEAASNVFQAPSRNVGARRYYGTIGPKYKNMGQGDHES